jgi:hypothetical protein
MDGDDYLVVMVYVKSILLGYLVVMIYLLKRNFGFKPLSV